MTPSRSLGRSSLAISPVGLGTWALGGGDWGLGWGEQDDADSVATIRRAVELGVNWIDTAAVYGLGHSERVVARALSDLPATDRPHVFTKCGLPWDAEGRVYHSLEPASIRREIEASLRRLEVSAIDLYQIHWPVYPPDRPAPGLEAAWETLLRLVEEGKARFIGLSNFDREQLRRVEAIASVPSLQSPYSLLRRKIEAEILPYAEHRGIGVLVYSPLQSGLLSGKMTRKRLEALPANDWRKSKSLDFQEPHLSRNLALVDRLGAVASDKEVSPAALAVAWALRPRAVCGAIVGARNPGQIEELVPAGEVRVTEEEAALLAP